jgi:hypothetical protein
MLLENIWLNQTLLSIGSDFMKQGIVGYHIDDVGHWVAELACGHFQHVRHDPPMVQRPWVLTKEGRDEMLGYELECKKCNKSAPKDVLQAIE